MAYNGWSGYATWCVKLWMDNEYPLYHETLRMARDFCKVSDDKGSAIHGLSNALEGLVEEMTPQLDGMFGDLMGYALGEVNWYEIAESMIDEGWDEYHEEEEEEAE